MLSKAKQALEFGHQRRMLLLCRPSNELLLDVRLDGALDLDFEEVEFVAVLDVLEPLVFEDGLRGWSARWCEIACIWLRAAPKWCIQHHCEKTESCPRLILAYSKYHTL